jgi:hypothetical protein
MRAKVRIFKAVSQKPSKHPLECKILGAISVNCPRLSNSNLPVFPLVLSFGFSPAFHGTIRTVSLPMPQRRSAIATPDAHLLFLSLRLLCILGEELAIVVARQAELVIRWTENSTLKIATALATHHFA